MWKACRCYTETLFVAFHYSFDHEVQFGGTQLDENTIEWYVSFLCSFGGTQIQLDSEILDLHSRCWFFAIFQDK